MQSSNLAGTLTLCRRAGRLAVGYDQVKESVQKTDAFLILLAQDVSPKTAERVRFLAAGDGLPVYELPFSMDEMEQLLGKRIGVTAIADRGFAGSLLKKLEELSGR